MTGLGWLLVAIIFVGLLLFWTDATGRSWS